MMLELRQPWHVHTPKGKARVLCLLDYGADTSTLFLCASDETGEMWWWSQKDVRLEGNITFGTHAAPVPVVD